MKTILVTGAAGFIGFHLSKLLCKDNIVIGIDNVNSYYSKNLKKDRLDILEKEYPKNFFFKKLDLCDKSSLKNLIESYKFDYVINMAAQAGVRYSLENPDAYIESNIIGFHNLLDLIKEKKIQNFIFLSSSRVSGMTKDSISSRHDHTDAPVSLYAASKKSNEVIAHSYSHLYEIPTTGLRFLQYMGHGVVQIWHILVLLKNSRKRIINVYGDGSSMRDYTYISDVISCIKDIIIRPPKNNFEYTEANSKFQIYNIGNNKPVKLIKFINTLEEVIGIKANLNYIENQKGDVPTTFANIDDTIKEFDYNPKIRVNEGLINFYNWYKEYYHV